MSLKFKIVNIVIALALSLAVGYLSFLKKEDKTISGIVNAAEVNFEGIDQRYKILIYQNDELKYSSTSGEKLNIDPGQYQLIVVDSENEEKKEVEKIEVPKADKVNINLSEVQKKLEASPTPLPTKVTGEIDFIDPLSKCEGYTFNRAVTSTHSGVDLAKRKGCIIVAAAEGKVVKVGWGEKGQGFYIVIEHKNGFKTEYYHGTGEFYVKEGDEIAAGTEIMYMGTTGNATGTHLHFEIRKDGKAVNPESYIEFKK